MYETLYRKYRPRIFDDFCGNQYTYQAIKNSLVNERMAHAYLFCGPRGTGKTSLARLISKSLNCMSLKDKFNPCDNCDVCLGVNRGSFPDMVEIDAASNRGIDEIRELKEKVNYKPIMGKKKIYIIDEVHMLTKEAFNALLKTLEEPPKHVLFILATTEPEKLPETIISRCQRYDFTLLGKEELIARLKFVSESEKREVEEGVFNLVHRESGSSMRDALSLLDKVFACCEKVTMIDAEKVLGIVPHDTLQKFYNAVFAGDLGELYSIIDECWIKGFRIASLFKDFVVLCRDKRSLKETTKIAELVYTAVNEFRLEDDKQAVAYVIIGRLGKLLQPHEEIKVVKRQVQDKVVEPKVGVKPIMGEKVSAPKIEEVKEEIVEEIKEEVVEQEASPKIEAVVPVPAKPVATEEIQPSEPKVEGTPLEKLVAKESKTIYVKPDGSFNVESVQNRWGDIVKQAKDKKISLMMFLNTAKVFKLENNKLFISYDREHAFHKESMDKRENKILFEGILHKMFNKSLDVEVMFGGEEIKEKNFASKVQMFLDEDK